MIHCTMTQYNHPHIVFVKPLSKVLSEGLFRIQGVQELAHGSTLSIWAKHLYGLMDELNHENTSMIGMAPADMIKLKEVPLDVPNYRPEDVLLEDGLYQ